MAHVQHQQATSGTLATQSPLPDILKLEPAPLKCRSRSRHGSLQPQENDEEGESDGTVDSEKELFARPHRLSDRCQLKTPSSQSDDDESRDERRATTLLPELGLICTLTRCLTDELAPGEETQQELQDNEDDEGENDAASLASLYCQRAKALLKYAKYDAFVRIPLGLLELLDSELIQNDTVLCISSDGWCAVQQALSDALAAITSDPRAPDAHYVAAQCARSLGNSQAAIGYVETALQHTPQQKKLHSLLRQLLRETDGSRLSIAPPLLCRPVSPQDEDPEVQQQQQAHEEDNDEDDEDDAVLLADIQRRFRAMHALGDSPLLRKLEPMMHESLHHQCASTEDALALTEATNDTVAFLRLLLFDDADATSRAIALEASELHATAAQLTDAKRLVNSPSLRRWLVRTLAPAVMQSLPQGLTCQELPITTSRAALLRDVLLTLARLWLAMGNLQRCTNVPHALAVSKLALDLTKQFTAAPVKGGEEFRRMEMACKDAYALALLDLAAEAGEAILLHQETLELALKLHDRDRELISRHLLGRALLRISEYDSARTELRLLLQQSDALGDSGMACLALYSLGECYVAEGDLDEAMELFQRALVVCHKTAHGHGTWRKHSIQRAMEFYACLMRPTRRRPAMRRSVESKGRKATLVVTPQAEQDSSDWTWEEERADEGTTRRRAAVWMTSAAIGGEGTSTVRTPRRSLAETLIGGYTGEAAHSEPEMREEREMILEEGMEPAGPLTTLGVTLTSWLIGQPSTTSPTRPACCKPME